MGACFLCLQARSRKVYFSNLLSYFVAGNSGSCNSGSQPGNAREIWMVFPWYEMTFAELWRSRTGVFFREEVEQLVGQLFQGVACLHRVQVMHGDLSFSNLLMRAGPCSSQLACKFGLAISDFGSACVAPARTRPACTDEVKAPELVLRVPAEQLTPAIDVWAAGIFVASVCKGSMFPKCPECMCVLGPLTEADWPGCSAMPAFLELGFARLAARCPRDSAFRMWYSGGIGCGEIDATVDLLEKMLTWTASRRKSIADLMGHSFFQGVQAETQLRNALRHISRECLEEVVMQCGRGGVTLRDVLAMSQRPPADGQPVTSNSARSQTGASDEVAKPEGGQGAACQTAPEEVQVAPVQGEDSDPIRRIGPCHGNCGRVSCKHSQNHGVQPVCQTCQETHHPSGRCDLCRCESHRC